MEEILKISLIAYIFCALGYEENMIFSWYQKLIRRLPIWLSFLLGACYKCFVGQVCFWYLIIKKKYSFAELDGVIEFLFLIAIGIFASVIYNKIWDICESGQ